MRLTWRFLGLVLLGGCSTSQEDRQFEKFNSKEVEERVFANIDNDKLKKFQTQAVPEATDGPAPKKLLVPKKQVLKPEATGRNPEKKMDSPSTPVTDKKVTEAIEDQMQPAGPVNDEQQKLRQVYNLYDQDSLKAWEQFSPRLFTGESHVFEVSYLGLVAGYVKLEILPEVNLADRRAIHLKASLRSARYYSYIYKLDDTLDSYVDAETFLPLKYLLIQRESGQSIDDLQLFDHDLHKTFFFYKRIKKDKNKQEQKEAIIPRYFQDSYSSLYFVRGLPLEDGDIYKFPVITRAKLWIIRLKVEKREEITVNGKDYKAIRVNALTQFPGVLKKQGDILFWYSDDESRRLLKFQAKVKIGSLRGELVEYNSASNDLSATPKVMPK